MRIYTYHNNGHNLNKFIEKYNIVDNELEKIIIMNENILMFSYSDNKNAEYLNKLYLLNGLKNIEKDKRVLNGIGVKTPINHLMDTQNKKNFEDLLIKLLKNIIKIDFDIKIDDIRIAYWKEGIHYFKPQKDIKLKNLVKNLSQPHDNFYVCGEMLSFKQGWVEGCIESVNRLITLIK